MYVKSKVFRCVRLFVFVYIYVCEFLILLVSLFMKNIVNSLPLCMRNLEFWCICMYVSMCACVFISICNMYVWMYVYGLLIPLLAFEVVCVVIINPLKGSFRYSSYISRKQSSINHEKLVSPLHCN